MPEGDRAIGAVGFRRDEKSALSIPRFFLHGWLGYRANRRALRDVERYCMFVGYPRSGHSLVGSLLNAHPEAVVAHEVNLMRYLRYGFPRNVLLGMLLYRDREFGARGRGGSGYDYRVNDQFQGHFTRLRVLGDKRGRASSRLLGKDPALLDRLQRRLNLPLRVIHHVRNPFDNIATMARRADEPLERSAWRYFRLASAASATLARLEPEERITSYHEDFVADPESELARLVGFLGLEPHAGFLHACAQLVFESPRRSRDHYDWPSETVASIEKGMAAYPHLQRYLP